VSELRNMGGGIMVSRSLMPTAHPTTHTGTTGTDLSSKEVDMKCVRKYERRREPFKLGIEFTWFFSLV